MSLAHVPQMPPSQPAAMTVNAVSHLSVQQFLTDCSMKADLYNLEILGWADQQFQVYVVLT